MLRKEFEKGINLMSLFIALTVKLSFSMINYIFITPESITIHFYCYLSRYIYLLLNHLFSETNYGQQFIQFYYGSSKSSSKIIIFSLLFYSCFFSSALTKS